MSTAADGDWQAAGPPELHSGDDIRNSEAAEDHRRMPVNRAVPDLPILLIARISRFDDVPAKSCPINLHRFGAEAHRWSVSGTPKVAKHAAGSITRVTKPSFFGRNAGKCGCGRDRLGSRGPRCAAEWILRHGQRTAGAGSLAAAQGQDAGEAARPSSEAPAAPDVVSESLWPDAEPEAASNNLHQTLHQLRRTIGPTLIAFSDDIVVLCPTGGLTVDVDVFERTAATARNGGDLAALDVHTSCGPVRSCRKTSTPTGPSSIGNDSSKPTLP